jgi:hypothetical protein
VVVVKQFGKIVEVLGYEMIIKYKKCSDKYKEDVSMVNSLLLWTDYSNLRHGHGGKHGDYGDQQQQQQKNANAAPKTSCFLGWWYLANHNGSP